MSQRLVRPRGALFAGVCAGLGRYFGVNPFWVRLAWVVSVLCYGSGFLLYLVMWWIMPREDRVPVEPTVWVRTPSGAHPPLLRTVYDRKIFGACGGIARRFAVDPAWVRLATLLLGTASVGVAFLVYLVAAVLLPTQRSQAAKPALV